MSGLDRSRNLLDLLDHELRPEPDSVPSPLLESVVVNYLLTVVYSDLEQAIRAELADQSAGGSDPRTNAFVAVALSRIVRSIKCSEIAGVLGLFDEACKRHFQQLVNDTPAQVAYDRIVTGRHEQAHSLGSDMTLADFKGDLQHCQTVLDAVAAAIRCLCH